MRGVNEPGEPRPFTVEGLAVDSLRRRRHDRRPVPRSQVVENPKGSSARAAVLPALAARPYSASDRLFVCALLFAAAAINLGLIWDMSWDMSFGRDSFWSPPHVMVNAGGALAAAAALAWVVFATRRGDPRSVRVGRVRVPLGAALALWGSGAMLAAGGLEIAWSRAYGMAVGAWTPPQVLFVCAMAALMGGVVLVAGSRRAEGPWLALPCAAGLALTFAGVALAPYTLPNLQHGRTFFLLTSAVFPLLLAWSARSDPGRSVALKAAAVYTAAVCAMIWILPLVPAHALIGPVFEKVDHMVPPRFPLLLLVPALVFDRMAGARDPAGRDSWANAVVLGLVFTAMFVAVQWVFAGFLLSPASEGFFFAGGGRHWPFYVDIGEERRQFWEPDGRLTLVAALLCVILATLSARVGLALGRFTEDLER